MIGVRRSSADASPSLHIFSIRVNSTDDKSSPATMTFYSIRERAAVSKLEAAMMQRVQNNDSKSANPYIPYFENDFTPNGFMRLEFENDRLIEDVREPDLKAQPSSTS